MATDYHLKLSLSGELWNEMLAAALPVRLAGDELHLARSARSAVHRLGLRQRVAEALSSKESADTDAKSDQNPSPSN